MPISPGLEVRTELGPWRHAWDDLVARQPVPTPFQRSWWLESVSPVGTTYALVVAGADLLGGVALGLRRVRGATRYVAPGPEVLCPDHLDAVAAAGADDAVVAVLAEWFRSEGPRLVNVRGVVDGSLLARVVGGVHPPDELAPYQCLEGADFLATRSSSFRRSVRRGGRRLAGLGLEHRRVLPAQVPEALDAFARLHEGRDGREGLLVEMPRLRAAFERGVDRGEARVDVLASDTEVAAVTLGLELEGRLSLYQVARSIAPEHDSAGTVLLAAVVEDAAARGLVEVDLLRGDEGYKGSFADHRRPLVHLRAAHGVRATAVLRAEEAARRALSARRRSRGR